jgi:hypothetical protein
MDSPPQLLTWYGGLDVTPAVLNTYLTDAFNFLGCLSGDKPVFRAYQTIATSVESGTWTPLGMEEVLEDTAGGWSSAAASYTSQSPGWYRCTGCYCSSGGDLDSSRAGFYYTQETSGDTTLYCGDVITIPGTALGDDSWCVFIYLDIYLETGDQVQLQGYQDTGGTLDNVTNGYGDTSSLEIEWVSN